MIVGVFLASANHPHYVGMLEAFAEGIRSSGDTALMSSKSSYQTCDVAVFFGSWKNRPVRHHVTKNDILDKHQGPFVVIETPLLGRKIEVEYEWYRIGINHYLNELADFNNYMMPEDRWQMISRQLRLQVKPYRNNGSHIVVALQLPGDASLLGTDISKWAVEVVAKLRLYTDRPIIIRPHKLVREYRMDLIQQCIQAYSNVFFYDPSESMVRDDLINAWATVSFTSGYSVDSLLSGVPVFACHSGNMSWPVANKDLSLIETPKLFDRQQWLNDLSYAQWSISEMRQGLPWQHLRSKLCQYK